MKKLLTLLTLLCTVCAGAWAQGTAKVITDNASAVDFRLTIPELKALAGTGGHFAFHTTQRTDWSTFHVSDTNVNNLTSDQLYTLSNSTTENAVWITNYAGGTITNIGNGQQATYTANATSGFDLFIVDCGSTPHPSFGEKQFRLDNSSGNHLRIHSNDFTTATGDWTRYVAYGPFYVVTIQYRCNGETIGTKSLIATEGELTLTEAPMGYVLEGSPTIIVNTDGIHQVNVHQDSPIEGEEINIYNPACQRYVTNTLASTSNVANAATFIKVDCGENATYSDQQYPKFKLYIEDQGWVNSTNLTEGANRFSFSATDACEFIYVGNDIIPVSIIGTNGSGGHGQLSWNWHGGASDSNVMGLYGQGDGNSNWTFCKQYTVSYAGLQNAEEGGITYFRANYTGTEMLLPSPIDESALIAMHVSGYNGTVSVDEANKTITVTYSNAATAGPTLWSDNNNSSNLPAARIPAIVKSQDYILAFSDWRYNRNDIGRGDNGKRIDIEMRRSHDNGQTWEPAIIVAQGTGISGYEAAHGDAAVVADRESGKVLMLAASGNATDFSGSSRSNPIKIGKFTSSDNGANWEKSEVTSSIYGLFPETVTKIFVSSGKILQGSVKKAGAANYRIYAVLCTNEGNHVIYSDDFGTTWGTLGNACAAGNEAHVTELPNGDLLLDSRAGGARYVNVYTYANKQDGMAVLGDSDEQGAWGTYGTMGVPTSSDGCNGDIDIMTAYPAGSSEAVKVVLQTSPRSGRNNVSYYYMRLPEAVDGQYNVNDFVGAAKWTSGYEVFHGASAYTSIFHDEQGDVHMFFEKNTTSSTWSYNMTYEKHNISQITNNAYFGEDPMAEQTIVAILSDGNGNTFEHEYHAAVGTLPTVPAYCTVATDGIWAKVDDHFTYTAGITMPFVVSNNENTKYYNIYYPIATGSAPCYLYYNSNNASQLRNDHSVTNKGVDDAQVMTASKENTYKYSWAIYGDPFTGFTFKNRQSNTFINIAGASASGTQNAGLAAEGSVFTLDYATNGTYNGRWTMQSGTGYIVLWSWANDVATYNTNANHQGGHFYLVEAPDFEAMTTTLGEKCEGLGTTLGTYAYTGSAEDLNTAKSIVAGETTPTNAKQLNTLITALTNGRGTLNMPQSGMFLRIKSHKFGTYLNSTPVDWNGNSNLLTLVNGKTGANEKTTIMYLTEDSHLVTYATGMGLCNCIQIKTADSDPYEGNTVLTFSEDSGNAGCYNIKGVAPGYDRYLYGYSDKLARNGSVTDECVWELEEVETLPVSLSTVDGHAFGTFYTPVAVTLPTGVNAYGVTVVGNTALMSHMEDGVIPAGQAAVLYAPDEKQTAVNFTIGGDTEYNASANVLAGNVATQTVAASTVLTMQNITEQNGGTGIGFYNYTGTTLKGFKAYLPKSSAQGIQSFAFNFDDITTGIQQLENANQNVQTFDLSGRQVNKAQRGLYIVGGRKVIR